MAGQKCIAIKAGPASQARGDAGERCQAWPLKGQLVCGAHGGRSPQAKQAAAARLATARAEAAIAREAEKTGKASTPNQSPLDVLESAMADIVRLKDRLGSVVETLEDNALRYSGRAGEQLRGELQAYQSALRDTVKAAETMLKLGIAEKRLALQEREVGLLIWVVNESLRAAGVDTDSDAVRQIVQGKLIEASDQDERVHAKAALERRPAPRQRY